MTTADVDVDVDTDVPDSFKCPITHECMSDPVILRDGHTYDRVSIESWFSSNRRTSPVTNLPLNDMTMVPNHALRNAIEEFKTARAAGNDTRVKHAVAAAATAVRNNEFTVHAVSLDADGATVEVHAAQGSRTLPLAMVFVIDNSGSMASPASNNGTEASKLSRYALVKHSLLTAVEMAKSDTLFGLVAFNRQANVVFDLMRMTDRGKAEAKRKIGAIPAPNDCTNLYDGIKMGLLVASTAPLGFYTHVVVLTDGEPTLDCTPMGGMLPMVKACVDEAKPVVLSTIAYGMGAEIDSRLMYDIAVIGGGHYGYIPDGSMVGNVFVHFVANSLNKAAQNLPLIVQRGDVTYQTNLPHIDVDMPATVVLPPSVAGPDALVVLDGREVAIAPATGAPPPYKAGRAIFHRTVKSIFERMMLPLDSSFAAAKQMLEDAYARLSVMANLTLECSWFVESLVHAQSDKGQIGKAIERDAWQKWGRHYLGSVVRAHERQERGNFKDLDQRVYGGDKFNALVSDGEAKFKALPPPVADVGAYSMGGGTRGGGGVSVMSMSGGWGTRGGRSSSPTFVNTQSLMSASGICFGGDTVVHTPSGDRKISDLRKGDTVFSPFKGVDTVECVVRTRGRFEVCTQEGASFTPWHPVRDSQGRWRFPADVLVARATVNEVFNLVLRQRGEVAVGSSTRVACTLGHGCKDDAVIAHEYFGTDRIIDDLKTRFPKDYETGTVDLTGVEFARDATTGLVTGMR